MDGGEVVCSDNVFIFVVLYSVTGPERKKPVTIGDHDLPWVTTGDPRLTRTSSECEAGTRDRVRSFRRTKAVR
jgi:hypothetical protein